MKWRRGPDPIDGVLLVALVLVVLAVTRAYVTSERFFYYWDHALFQDLAETTASAFRESGSAGLREVRRSLQEDYNALYAIPLAPFLIRFGDSRLSYELALALVYLCPFALALGALGARVLAVPPRPAFWTTAGLALLVPMSWIPTLRGYPDTGAATLVVLAMCLYLRHADGTTPSDGAVPAVRDAAAVGVLLGLAVLFRRHFLYAATAFVASAVAYECAGAGRRWQRGTGRLRQDLGALALRLLAGAAAAALTMAALGRGFLARLGSYDFLSLYRGYEEPLPVVARWYLGAFGWTTLAAALLGWTLGLRAGRIHRRRAAFVLLLGAISAVQWLVVVRQLGEQYTLHFTPVIVVGLAALLHSARRAERGRVRLAMQGALALLLAVNVVLGLYPASPALLKRLGRTFAGSWPPLVRSDHAEIVELVESLRDLAKPDEGIFVVASSPAINADLLRHAELALHPGQARLRLLRVPTVDSRDRYPLDDLLEAQHVVLVRPLQTHLRPEEQRVLGVVYDLFTTHQEIARDFAPTPVYIGLAYGVTVTVQSRARPTDLTTGLRTLALMEQRIPSRPGLQADWVAVSRRFPSWLSRNPDGSTACVAHPSRRGEVPSTVLAYVGPRLREAEFDGTVRFIDARCPGATLDFFTVDDEGRLDGLATVRRRPGDDGRFQVRVAPGERRRLALSLLDYGDGASIDHCLLKVDPLIGKPERP